MSAQARRRLQRAQLVLASSSPARQALLRDAGIAFEMEPSGVEEVVFDAPTGEVVLELARQKAAVVASRRPGGLVLGCDSLLEVDGVAYGKPISAHDAIERWRAQRARTATLYTGHVLIDAADGRQASEVVATTVRFAAIADEEIEAYVASGEPLDKAGAFTLEGRSAPFVEGVEGDPSNVRGLSLPALRRLLGALGTPLIELWR